MAQSVGPSSCRLPCVACLQVPGLSVLVGALTCGRLVCLGIEMYFIAQWVQMMTTGYDEASHQA